jgi:type IV pilus assembly protein PilA
MKRNKGFTLIELIVTISILAILSTIAVPRVTGYIDKAKTTKAITIGKQIQMAAVWSYSEMGDSFNETNLLETIKLATGLQSINSSSIKNITSRTVAIEYISESKNYVLNINMNNSTYTIAEGAVNIFSGN